MNTATGYSQQVLIPAADVMYKGSETSIQLLQSQKYVDQAQLLNNSIQSLEYVLSNGIRALSRGQKPTVAFLRGHGELPLPNLSDIIGTLWEYYNLDTAVIDGNINSLTMRTQDPKDSTFRFKNRYDLIIVAKPTKPFSDQDLYKVANSSRGWYARANGDVINFILNPTVLATPLYKGTGKKRAKVYPGLVNPLLYYQSRQQKL